MKLSVSPQSLIAAKSLSSLFLSNYCTHVHRPILFNNRGYRKSRQLARSSHPPFPLCDLYYGLVNQNFNATTRFFSILSKRAKAVETEKKILYQEKKRSEPRKPRSYKARPPPLTPDVVPKRVVETENQAQPSGLEDDDASISSTVGKATKPVSSVSYVTEAGPEVVYGDIAFEWVDQPENPRSLNVVIMGTPNAGKSYLVNQLVKDKITAVSQKRNTTREEILGVATSGNTQLVIYDTPGINQPAVARNELGELSVAAWARMKTADLGLVLVDSVKKIGPAEMHLFSRIKKLLEQAPNIKLVLVLNKVDLCKPKHRLLYLAKNLWEMVPYERCFMISAKSGDGVDDLENWLLEQAVPREWEFGANVSSDQSALDRVEEVIREKIYRNLHREIPYHVTQQNMGWTEIKNGSLRIDQGLIVHTSSHQKILTNYLTTLGIAAKPDIEKILSKTVHLFFHVILKKTTR